MAEKLTSKGLERREIHLHPTVVNKLTKKAKRKNLKLKPYLEQLAVADAKSNGE